MKKPLDDEVRLRHMLEAANHVEEFVAGKTKDDLHNQPMLRFAVERQLEIIGEAVNRLSDSLKQPALRFIERRVPGNRMAEDGGISKFCRS